MSTKQQAAPELGVARRARLKDLMPDPVNANKGTRRGAAMLESSLRDYGAGRGICADKNGVVIAGNKTLEAAALLGFDEIVIVPTDGRQLVVTQRTDLDLEQDAQAKALAIADNRTGEVGLEWDPAVLEAFDKEDVDLGEFFSDAELEKLLESAQVEDPDEPSHDVPDMEIRPFEHHDYIVIVFRDVHDWSRACDLLNIRREGVSVGKSRRIGVGRVISSERFFKVWDGRAAAKGDADQ